MTDLQHLARHQLDCWLAVGERLGVPASTVSKGLTRLLDSVNEHGDLVIRDSRSGAVRALAVRSINPWTGLEEGFVYAMAARDDIARSIGSLTATLRRLSSEAEIRLWRAEILASAPDEVSAALQVHGWARHYDLVAVRLPIELAGDRPPGTSIRAATARDEPFVTDLLFRAVWGALVDTERSRGQAEQVRRAVAAEYAADVASGSCFSLVAVDHAGCQLGHATARLLGSHPILGLEESELVDVFTLPSVSGRGIGPALTAGVLCELSGREAEVAFGTLDLLHTPAERLTGIQTQLRRTGWWRFSTFWLLET